MRLEPPVVIHLRVLFALIMREMTTRYGRNAGGYVWAVLEPAGAVAMLSLVFSAIARRPPLGDSFPVFFATGYMAFHVYADVSRAVSGAVTANQSLLAFPRVTILDAILARFVLHLLTTAFVAALVIAAAVAIYDEPVTLRPSAILLATALAAALGLSVGLLNCILFAYSNTWKTVFGIVNRPLFLISGVFFTYEALPRAIQALIWWNPLIHVTALMRSGFYPTYDPAFAAPLYVTFFAAAPFVLGALLLRLAKGRLLEQ